MKPVPIQKVRWSKVYESSEEELVEFLRARGVAALRTHLDEYSELTIPPHAGDTTMWCAEGSFNLNAGGAVVSMQPGDGARIPADTTYHISAGISGCVWYQAAL